MLKVGTDCSGIEAPIQALEQMNKSFVHKFSSDIDKFCIKSIKANYNPEIIFGDKEGDYPEGDIRKRNIDEVPDIDLYVAGFPCQPFSMASGKNRKGSADERGDVFWGCYKTITEKQPKYFILENVKGLLNVDKGETWKVISKALEDLENLGYKVQWKVLNTKDYGIPQNRERLYIVGTKGKEFIFPEKTEMKDLKTFVDYDDKTEVQPSPYCLPYWYKCEKSIFVDTQFIRMNTCFPNGHKICPCICTRGSHYNVLMKRYANKKELLSLQGFPKDFKQVVSKTQMNKQIGNSMSVNVLKSIFENLLE